MLRVSAENLNRLLSLAGESLVESRWVKPFAESLLRLKRLQHDLTKTLEIVRDARSERAPDDPAQAALADAQRRVVENEQFLAQRLAELEMFDRRSIDLAHRLYEEALACRMRPFADGVEGLPRMVRDLARSLGRQVKLEIVGGATQVDRDILAKLDAPLGHLLRNAVDHGVESPEAREAAGKSPEGLVRVEARHSAGALQIIVSDDGAGVDLEKLREAVVARKLTTRDASRALSEAELLEFLFLPGFTMKATVTDVSGRGVGLDAGAGHGQAGARDGSRLVPGGQGHALSAAVAGDALRRPHAAGGHRRGAVRLSAGVHRPHAQVVEGQDRAARRPPAFRVRGGRHIGLVTARQVFAADAPAAAGDDLPVIVVGDQHHAYGLVVDRFLGERELVVQPLDAQLGKIKDIAAGALMEDGSPVLIVDAEDMIRSMDKLASGGRLATVPRGSATGDEKKRKRVLVVDDSLTVRELERKLLGNRGYEVEVAVDGMDGWNAVRTGHFDLVVTDIDMPRMDGIELVTPDHQGPESEVGAGHDRVLQGPRRRPPARTRGRRGVLPDQGQLSRRDAAAGRRRFDRRAGRVRIGIVNDLAAVAELLQRVVCLEPANRVVWIARNGAEAVELCAKDTPDLILMDMVMPAMDGVETTRRIMASTPCAILIVTGSVRVNAGRVFEAMGHGALDAVDTPLLGRGRIEEAAGPLLAKIATISRLVGDKRGRRRVADPAIAARSRVATIG